MLSEHSSRPKAGKKPPLTSSCARVMPANAATVGISNVAMSTAFFAACSYLCIPLHLTISHAGNGGDEQRGFWSVLFGSLLPRIRLGLLWKSPSQRGMRHPSQYDVSRCILQSHCELHTVAGQWQHLSCSLFPVPGLCRMLWCWRHWLRFCHRRR